MSKNFKIAFGSILLLVMLLTYLEATEPEPVNWNPSYLESDKIALGSYVFFESWKKNSSANIENVAIPPFEFLDEDPSGIYFFLNDVVVFDDNELERVLKWAEKGNTVFISAGYLSKNLLDTLNMKTTTYSGLTNFVSRPKLNFVHPELKDPEDFEFSYDLESLYFNEIDTLNHTVLGISRFTNDPSEGKKVNFVKAEFGAGEILLHSNPQALGNYFLLTNDNYRYAEGILAYIDQGQKVYWDNYYKSGKVFYSSPLYVLLDNRALKWAYYFVLLGSLVFIIFEGKRKQRAIPVVTPLKNQTYEYSKTISELYLEQKQYKALALKNIEHFYDYIRTKFRIYSSSPPEIIQKELAAKTDHNQTETKKLFNIFNQISTKKEITKAELLELDQAIKAFKDQQNG